MSSPQVVPLITIFDYVYDQGGVAYAGAKVYATLQYNQAINLSPQVSIAPIKYFVETDSNGYWQFMLAPNPALTPAGTTYLIQTPYVSYEVSVPSSGGPYQATSILVNQPTVLTPATSTVGALTVSGLLTAQAGLTVTGTVTLPANSLPESAINGLTTALGNTVNLTGTQTVAGAKTFTSLLTESAGEAVTGGLSTDTLATTGNATVGGTLGSTGVITATAGVINHTAYKARMYLTGAVTYTYNVQTIVPFNNTDYDPNSNISLAAHSWTAPIAGYFYVNMNVAVSTSASETLSVIPLIYRNGSEVKRAQVAAGTLGSGTNLGVPVSAILSLSLGDVITGYIFQVNSASANLSGPVGSNQAYMEVHYLSS